jgi:hypothetical protein
MKRKYVHHFTVHLIIMRVTTFRSTTNMRYAECMRNFGRKCKGKTPFSKATGEGHGVKIKLLSYRM